MAPPSSVTLLCTSSVSVSASTDKVMAVGVSSSSRMVPTADRFSGGVKSIKLLTSIRKVSFGSSITSSMVATSTVAVVDPAGMVTHCLYC